MKQTTITIATEKGPEPLDAFLLPGMYTSGLCIVGFPNNGGGTSYGITHTNTGWAIIGAKTDDLDLVASMLRKLWKALSTEEKQLLKLKDVDDMRAHPHYSLLGAKVVSVKNTLEHKIAEAIRREVRAEREARNRPLSVAFETGAS